MAIFQVRTAEKSEMTVLSTATAIEKQQKQCYITCFEQRKFAINY